MILFPECVTLKAYDPSVYVSLLIERGNEFIRRSLPCKCVTGGRDCHRVVFNTVWETHECSLSSTNTNAFPVVSLLKR
jgi:hypothetical protein